MSIAIATLGNSQETHRCIACFSIHLWNKRNVCDRRRRDAVRKLRQWGIKEGTQAIHALWEKEDQGIPARQKWLSNPGQYKSENKQTKKPHCPMNRPRKFQKDRMHLSQRLRKIRRWKLAAWDWTWLNYEQQQGHQRSTAFHSWMQCVLATIIFWKEYAAIPSISAERKMSERNGFCVTFSPKPSCLISRDRVKLLTAQISRWWGD